jgi:formiminotetrahydrofolate cyclodeaminase
MPAGQSACSELLSALAARSPAPGGGSAAAWAGALAAAVLEMCASFADEQELVDRASALRDRLVDAAEAELHSYEPVLTALRLPPTDQTRAERLTAALSDASAAPLEIVRVTTEVAELSADVAGRGKPALRGDAVTAALLAESVARAASELVAINLGDDPRVEEVGRLSARAAAARARALEGG